MKKNVFVILFIIPFFSIAQDFDNNAKYFSLSGAAMLSEDFILAPAVGFGYEEEINDKFSFCLKTIHVVYSNSYGWNPSNTIVGGVGYKMRLVDDRFFYKVSFLCGASYNNMDEESILPVIQGNLNLNIRLWPRFYIELPPLLVFAPVSQITVSPFAGASDNGALMVNIAPVGLRWRIN